MLLGIGAREANVRAAVCDVLRTIGSIHPMLLIHPLAVAAQETQVARRTVSRGLINGMRSCRPELVTQVCLL